MSGQLRVGPAGWDYADWQGVVYPPGLHGTERLTFLSRLFAVVEINVTFYRPVSAHLARRWVEAVADRPEFRFTAKLFRGLTHERTEAAWQEEGAVKAGLDYLMQEGRLGALLAQFPYSFHNNANNRAYLLRLRERFAAYPLAVEVRHRSWQQRAAREFLAAQDLAFCNIDQPQVSYSLGATDWVTGPFAYLRLHGRNREQWFAGGEAGGARYDYYYSPAELDELAARTRRLLAAGRDTYLIFNNHPRGQGVANALEMLARLQGRVPTIPEPLRRAFPRLAYL